MPMSKEQLHGLAILLHVAEEHCESLSKEANALRANKLGFAAEQKERMWNKTRLALVSTYRMIEEQNPPPENHPKKDHWIWRCVFEEAKIGLLY